MSANAAQPARFRSARCLYRDVLAPTSRHIERCIPLVSVLLIAILFTFFLLFMPSKEENVIRDEPLFDPRLLESLDLNSSPLRFSPPLTIHNPGQSLRVRPLCTGDFDRGFLQLLTQLTAVGDVSREQFMNRFDAMRMCSDTYYVIVVEDSLSEQIVAAATLVVEQKFIHNTALRGRLEDVVVNEDYRGRQLGKLIVQAVFLLAKKLSCYKLSCECKDHLVPFYESNGFKSEAGNSNFMVVRFS